MNYQNWKRRDFIKAGLSGSAGLLVIDSVRAEQSKKEEKINGKKFVYRTLGKTGLRLPVISMGIMNADNPALVDAALKAGIVHLDTAYVYQRGRNEEMIGKVIKNYNRNSYVISTKVKANESDPAKGEQIIKEMVEKVETSLQRLQLEYVDILYLHGAGSRADVLFDPAV
jgi:uncharacterized protein